MRLEGFRAGPDAVNSKISAPAGKETPFPRVYHPLPTYCIEVAIPDIFKIYRNYKYSTINRMICSSKAATIHAIHVTKKI
jgi:hypothetical protein